MIDTHLMNVTLALLGIGVGAVLFIAAAIVVGAVMWQRPARVHRNGLASPAETRYEPAVREPAPREPAPREPALH
jgi:hypothetical protein